MAIRLIVVPDGIDTTARPPTETHRLRVVGEDDENVVNAYVQANTPGLVSTMYGVLYRQDIQVDRAAYNQWDITVPYGAGKFDTGDFTWDFDTTGGTIHITQAKEEVGRYPTAAAPDQLGAIAVDGDEVKGTEIVVPTLRLNVRFRHPLGVITLARAKFLSEITGLLNSGMFLGFDSEEVLFLGARGSDGSEAEAEVTYQFAVADNLTNLTVGSITGVDKKAWDVAWIRYEDTITTVGVDDNPTRVAKFVYVDRVYDTIPLASALGFGA